MALPYFPIEEGDFKLTMGLQPLNDDSWIEIDANYERETRLRRSLLQDQRAAVFATTAAAAASEADVYGRVLDNLKTHHPDICATTPLTDDNDLLKAASLVQEDLVIMQETPTGFMLSAAAVCFPSAWNLAQKVGRDMRHIHAPVPGVNDGIGKSIDLFFNNMKQTKKVQRFNWGLYDREDLFQPLWWRENQPSADITADTLGDHLFFRVERQTLQRLTDSRDTLFTIRIFNTPLCEVAEDPIRAQRLYHHLKTMPDDFKAYKSISRYEDLILDYLRARM